MKSNDYRILRVAECKQCESTFDAVIRFMAIAEAHPQATIRCPYCQTIYSYGIEPSISDEPQWYSALVHPLEPLEFVA